MRLITQTIAIIALIALFGCTDKDNVKSDSLAKNIKTISYEVSLEIEADKPEWMANLNKQKLIGDLFDRVKNNELSAYDPFYFKAEAPISWQEIRANMGAGADTTEVLDLNTGEMTLRVVDVEIDLTEIKSLIFIEEWSTTALGAIQKNVLGVAPVRHYARNSMEELNEQSRLKRIAFVCYFSDKKPPLFSN